MGVQEAVAGHDVRLPALNEPHDIPYLACGPPTRRLIVDQLSARLVKHAETGPLKSEAVVDVVQVDPE
jgi:hypothetical protein